MVLLDSPAMRPPSRSGVARIAPVTAVVLAAVLFSRLWLVGNPSSASDLPGYWHDAEIWGAAGTLGVSFYDLRAVYVVATAHAAGGSPAEGAAIVAYPPLAVAFMAAVNIGLPSNATPALQSDLTAYVTRYRQVMFDIDLAVLIVLAVLATVAPVWRNRQPDGRPWPWTTTWRVFLYGIGGFALYFILYDRLDLIVGVLLLASVLALVQGWWRVALAVLAAAIAFKLYPAVLAPIWLVASLPASTLAAPGAWRDQLRRVLRPLVTRTVFLGAVTGLLFAPFVLVQGTQSLQFIEFNAQRGVQLESVPAALAYLLQPLGAPAGIVMRYGSYEIASPLVASLAMIAIPFSALAVIVPWLLFVGRARRDLATVATAPAGRRERGGPTTTARPILLATRLPDLVVLAAVATLTASLAAGKVLSPQYLLWLLPLVPLLQGGRSVRAWQLVFFLMLILSTIIFPGLYQHPSLETSLMPAIIVRDLILIGLAAWAWLLVAGTAGRLWPTDGIAAWLRIRPQRDTEQPAMDGAS